MKRYWVGTSGWSYKHWKGIFYPSDLPSSKWLSFYTGYFSTVELNASFYRLPSESTFSGWHDNTPQDFLFSVKVSRLITHLKKLENVESELEKFVFRARMLKEGQGPLLYQLPPSMVKDEDRLAHFCSILPPDLSHVFEFRHESWFCDSVLDILRQYKMGFCIYDMPGFTTPILSTAEFAYVRFHGSEAMYDSCYQQSELELWAGRLSSLPVSVVFIYFNNDTQAYAVKNALTLSSLLGQPLPPFPGDG